MTPEETLRIACEISSEAEHKRVSELASAYNLMGHILSDTNPDIYCPWLMQWMDQQKKLMQFYYQYLMKDKVDYEPMIDTQMPPPI